jgi:hypothetical protein
VPAAQRGLLMSGVRVRRPPAPPARHAVTPTVVKETIVRPTADAPVTTLVLAGGGVVVAMFGVGYVGARLTRHPRL